jgi:hypothetical protein
MEKERIEVKKLAKILGKIVSLRPSHGTLSRICTRSGYLDVDQHVQKYNWKGTLSLSTSCKQEFIFFMMTAKEKNGFPIFNACRAIRVDTIFINPILKKETTRRFAEGHTNLIVLDSSDMKAAVIELEGGRKEELSFTFTTKERNLSSGHRELLAIKKSLNHWSSLGNMKRKRIFWATDSTNVVSFLEKGSSKIHVQTDIFEIVTRLMELDSDIIPVHLSREDERIRKADYLSKKEDSDDWSIDAMNFERIRNQYNLICDVFVSETNARLPMFFSELYSDKNSGTNAFSQIWGRGLWICPPVKLLINVANEIRRRKDCEGVILVPDWPTSHFYGVFFDENRKPRWPFIMKEMIEPYIYQNQGAKGPLNGKVLFKFFLLHFNRFIV